MDEKTPQPEFKLIHGGEEITLPSETSAAPSPDVEGEHLKYFQLDNIHYTLQVSEHESVIRSPQYRVSISISDAITVDEAKKYVEVWQQGVEKGKEYGATSARQSICSALFGSDYGALVHLLQENQALKQEEESISAEDRLST